jgi:hypothetical protein
MRALLAVVAVLVLGPPATGLAADAHRVSLASGELDGRQVLGRSIAEVTAMLGKPDFRSGSLRRPRIGWGRPDNFTFAVLFRPVDGRLRASTLVFERGTIRDDRVGNLLSRTPKSLQAAIASRYGTELVLVRPYQCRTRAGLCVGEFKTTAAKFHVTFGRSIGRSTFVTVWLATG